MQFASYQVIQSDLVCILHNSCVPRAAANFHSAQSFHKERTGAGKQ